MSFGLTNARSYFYVLDELCLYARTGPICRSIHRRHTGLVRV
jgi:hypothetical protein